jgi:hypothetical protein
MCDLHSCLSLSLYLSIYLSLSLSLAIASSPPPAPLPLDTPNAFTERDRPIGPVPFFGSSLSDLLLDEHRCAHAYLSPALGVPTNTLKLLHFLGTHAHTPNLFRSRASISAVEDLKKLLERTDKQSISGSSAGLPPNLDVSVAAYVLVQWLSQLPEPLFGYTHYSAFLACQEVESERERVKNLSLLLRQIPWQSKPLVVQLVRLFVHKCLSPENTKTNGLNRIAVALLITPILLRPYPYPTSSQVSGNGPVSGTTVGRKSLALSPEEMDRQFMAATAAGSTVIEFVLAHADEILFLSPSGLQAELTDAQRLLTARCSAIRTLQTDLLKGLPANLALLSPYEEEGERVIGLLRKVWVLLEKSEGELVINPIGLEREKDKEREREKERRRSRSKSMERERERDEFDDLLFDDGEREKEKQRQREKEMEREREKERERERLARQLLLEDDDDVLEDDFDSERVTSSYRETERESKKDEKTERETDGQGEGEGEGEILHPVASEHYLSLSPDLVDLVTSERWAVCGFTPRGKGEKATVLQSFSGNDGLVAMRCLEKFLEK